ncbi:peroxisomal biogenesis factor 11 [Piptocephalis cylindrospora]|uniref:Peroxisomal biogenesis factor 11 n=1 Tax=Piptocephalis cylindrospora TaxID=1907219 RepID=A0A4P9Y1L6_9FUNG|nr:peroxisomal biogenesis factor 11 [Piptocephalis cylindrospora]|eukprot:RKP11961.1 peroxisomal biogenesis factor 11 [Piptocephalis cylindrospora]
MPLTVTVFPRKKGQESTVKGEGPSSATPVSLLLATLLSPTLLPACIKFLKVSDGRDKTMKLVQYTLKLLLLSHLRSSKHKVLRTRLSALVSSFSTTRKILRLAHVIEPIEELRDTWVTGRPQGSLSAFLGVWNDLFDDIYCLAKIKVLSGRAGDWAERPSLYCWMASTILEIHENVAQQHDLSRRIHHLPKFASEDDEERAKLEGKLYWLRISLVKFLCDGFFCGYDLANASWSERAYITSGWLSGIMSTYKLWVKTNG